jgi:urea transport system ATP-binding protein
MGVGAQEAEARAEPGQGDEDVVLSCRAVSVVLDGVEILHNVSLNLLRGEIHVLIGPNGAGKTTLANAITGHVPMAEGRILFNGRPLTGPSWRRARRGLGRKFQVPRIFTRLTAQENIAVADARQRKEEGDGVVADLGQEIGVEEILDTPAEALSHGWRQRLEMRMVLGQRPVAGVLDEPTAGMPKSERAELARIIKEHRGQLTYLIVEHDMDFVEAVADRVSFMHEGRVTTTGTFEEIQIHPTVREIYLGETVSGSAAHQQSDAAESDVGS